MRSLVSHGLVLGSCLVAMVASAGCTAKKQTEYVGGISTQLQVPRDVKSVRVQISVGGAQVFCGGYKVYNGVATLPKSLGSYAVNDTSQSVRYEIAALSEEYDNTNEFFSVCDVEAVGSSTNVRVLRSSTQPYIPERILFLPLPLKYACYDVDCTKTPGQTCKAGECVDENMTMDDASKLPDFVDGMGEGTDGGCFSAGLCMGAAIPVTPLGSTSAIAGSQGCDFVLPETADSKAANLDPALGSDPFRPACTHDTDCTSGTTQRKCGTTTPGQCDFLPPGAPPWTGLNVEVSFDGGRTTEILDNDPIEGFTIPDPTKPQTFRLAPGLCNMYKGATGAMHRISAVLGSGTCGSKTSAQSICNADALALQGLSSSGTAPVFNGTCTSTPLTPTKAALAVVLDNTKAHSNLFNVASIDSIQLPLSDPAFGQTEFGLIFAPGTNVANACNGQRPLDVPFQNALDGVQAIRTALDANAPATLQDTNPSFSGGLASAYEALRTNFPTLLRRGVLVVGDRQMAVDPTCGGTLGQPTDLAATALTGGTPIRTFALELVTTSAANGITPGQDDAPGALQLAAAGFSTPVNSVPLPYFPTPTNGADKLTAFETIVDELASCAYDLPTDTTGKVTGGPNTTGATPDVLSYLDPVHNAQTSITFNAACNHDGLTGVQGWGTDGTHVFVCGNDCSAYQVVLKNSAAFGLTYNQPSLAVPLFYNPPGCSK